MNFGGHIEPLQGRKASLQLPAVIKALIIHAGAYARQVEHSIFKRTASVLPSDTARKRGGVSSKRTRMHYAMRRACRPELYFDKRPPRRWLRSQLESVRAEARPKRRKQSQLSARPWEERCAEKKKKNKISVTPKLGFCFRCRNATSCAPRRIIIGRIQFSLLTTSFGWRLIFNFHYGKNWGKG